MFTGIVESLGKVVNITKEGTNVHLDVEASFTHELQIDQSVAHNGVCLTVVGLDEHIFRVTAIDETLQKTNIGRLEKNSLVNLERCMKLGDRLDGHIVQGHVDQIATCVACSEENGSWRFTFEYTPEENTEQGYITVEKGSVCVNGVSLTVVDSKPNAFSVAIIPYTHEHTNFHTLEVGHTVNLEFDILGKYIARLHSQTAYQ